MSTQKLKRMIQSSSILLGAINSNNASNASSGWRNRKVATICPADVARSSVIYVVEFMENVHADERLFRC